MQHLPALISLIAANAHLPKDALARLVASTFSLTKERSVYTGSDFSIRFSTANGPSLPNCILSLSALQKYDHKPFYVCATGRGGTYLLLANSTFLKKVSHSSQALRTDNIRGTFLGSDILRAYDGIENTPENFPLLFEIHQQFTWEENLARLVEATNAIGASGTRFDPTPDQITHILNAPRLAAEVLHTPAYRQVETNLRQRTLAQKAAILGAARIDNVNLRGNRIEALLSQAATDHDLADLSFDLGGGLRLLLDLKTKLLDRSSSPKAYNIDKLLRALADGRTAYGFTFLGIDPGRGEVHLKVVSFLDATVLAATRIQHHWAGRGSRGVTQLASSLDALFQPGFSEQVDTEAARQFLRQLVDA